MHRILNKILLHLSNKKVLKAIILATALAVKAFGSDISITGDPIPPEEDGGLV